MIRFHCEKTLLQSAVAVTGRAVSPKSSIPALMGLFLHAEEGSVSLSGYDMKTGIRAAFPADVREGGDVVLDARLASDIIRRMPDAAVSVTVGDDLLVSVTGGDVSYQIPGLSAADFPELPLVDGDHVLTGKQSALKAMIEETVFAVSTSEARPVHTGALFETEGLDLDMAAVDGFRLAVRKEPLDRIEGGKISFVVPGSALNEVKNICSDTDSPITITLGGRHILFETEDVQLITRRLEGEFLDWRGAVPRDNPIAVSVACKDLMTSLDRVGVVISEKMKSPVRCRFGQGRLDLWARTPAGEARDVCPIEGDGQDLEIGFNDRYLMDALRHAPADRVRIELKSGVSPAVMVPEDGEEKFLYMVLPVRLKS